MNRADRICARCERFTVKDHPQQAAVGLGLCTGYTAVQEVFVRWDAIFCVLFNPAPNMNVREAWIARKESTNDR